MRRRAQELPATRSSSPATSRRPRRRGADRGGRRRGQGRRSGPARSARRASSPASACRSSPRSPTAPAPPRRTSTDHRRRRHQVLGRCREGARRRRDTVMIGSLFAGTDEAPGEIILFQGRSYKSIAAWARSARCRRAARTATSRATSTGRRSSCPRASRAACRTRARCAVDLPARRRRSGGMGYTGCARSRSSTTRRGSCSTTAGLRESHVHDVIITKEAPNYRVESKTMTRSRRDLVLDPRLRSQYTQLIARRMREQYGLLRDPPVHVAAGEDPRAGAAGDHPLGRAVVGATTTARRRQPEVFDLGVPCSASATACS